jgi:hypothetical protein
MPGGSAGSSIKINKTQNISSHHLNLINMQIDQILNGVKNLQIVLPEFQREYVWSLESAKQLFISLFKEYPTGSILFWQAKGEDLPDIKNNAVPTEKFGLTNVILDGQQRLTTLYLLIYGEIPPYYTETDLINDPRHLFFNLQTGEFQYYTKLKMQDNPLWQKVVDCYAKNKVDAIDVTEKYLKLHSDIEFRDLLKDVNKNLTRLLNIKTIDYPIQIVSPNAKIDEAIDVFDRVNSQGTKLTDAELVLTHITGKWPHARRELKKKIEQMKTQNFHLNLDFLTRCMVVALTDSALYNHNARLNYEHFTQKEYIEAWKNISKSLDFLIPILKQDGLIGGSDDMITINVLVPIIANLLKNDIKFSESAKFGFLYWMNLALIWSRYGGQTDARLDKDVYLATSGKYPIIELVDQIRDMRGRIDIKPSDLEGRTAGHPLYRMLYLITKRKKAIDWANGGPISETIGDAYSIQSHHIFPQSLLYKTRYNSENHLDKKIVNEIANRAFVTRDTNFKIYDQDPYEYLPKIEQAFPGSLERQFIPMNQKLWHIDSYEQFIEERRKLIAGEINSYLDALEQKYKKEPKKEFNWLDIIAKGENDYVEFKQSLRWSIAGPDRQLSEYIAMRAISSFLNSEGGLLFIGVSDQRKVIGISSDYQTFIKQNPDGFKLHMDNLINNYLGKEYHQYISVKIEQIDGKDICIVDTARSDIPVYLKSKDKDGKIKEEFFIRGSASSQPLGRKESTDYIALHWNNK